MTRPIKFRAWDKKEKIMRKRWDELYPECTKGLVLMQFTGLLDKNGKEIYEGDIVRSATYASMSADSKALEMSYEVYFDQGQWRIGGAALYAWKEWSEVIGNIYENSNLLQ